MVVHESDSLPETELAQRLRPLRTQRGWSQAELAQHMSEQYGLRWHQTTIAKIEAGQRPIGLNEAAALANEFDITGTELLMPFATRQEEADELRVREEQLRERSLAVEEELTRLIERQAAARGQVEKLAGDRDEAVQRVASLAATLRQITEQHEDAQRRHQMLLATLDRGLAELAETDTAVAQLRERHDFHRAELDQVRARRRQSQLQALGGPGPQAVTDSDTGWIYAVALAQEDFPGAQPRPAGTDWRWLSGDHWTVVEAKCCTTATRAPNQTRKPAQGIPIGELAEGIVRQLTANDHDARSQSQTRLQFLVAIPMTGHADHDHASTHLREAASEFLAKFEGSRVGNPD
ncbi:helix-turn-helix domain-containing protein [Actinoplanes sp. NPDC051343]|uniref:helix-turn-helix domain-containing protein n=1 Tax=Actinoplanes sp. NPDC051343 TaxID=3363906 RepID=UPI0037A8DC65